MSYFMPRDLNVLCANSTEHHGLIIFVSFEEASDQLKLEVLRNLRDS